MELDPDPCRDATCPPEEDVPNGGMRLHLAYRAPLAWPELRGFLVGRGAAGVEAAEGERYLRTVRLDGRCGWIAAEPVGAGDVLAVELSPELVPVRDRLQPRLRRLFDLDAHPAAIAQVLGADMRLAAHVAACPGLRVPGALDGFELALRAVLGQQVTVKAATTLFGRFARAFGQAAQTPHAALVYFAPQAEHVAEAPLQQLIDLGLTQRRAQTVSDLARAVASGALDLDGGTPIELAIGGLLAIPGIGPWTAQYVAMRALRDPDAFPSSDFGVMKALGVARPSHAVQAAEAWRPWRAYGALHLWRWLATGGG